MKSKTRHIWIIFLFIIISSGTMYGQNNFDLNSYISRYNQGSRFLLSGNYDTAYRIFADCWKEVENASLSDSDKRYLQLYLCSELGKICLEKGRYDEAEEFYLYGVEIVKLDNCPNELTYRYILSGLNILYTALHDYDNALLYGMIAKQLYEANNCFNIDYAGCLHNLGTTAIRTGDYADAKGFLIKAKQIIEEEGQTQHTSYLRLLNSLAIVYTEMADYDRSDNVALELLEISRKAGNTNTAEYGIAINQLGINCLHQHKNKQAEAYYEEALSILKPLLSEGHYLLPEIKSNLAYAYCANKNKRLIELSAAISKLAKQNAHSTFQFTTFQQRELYVSKIWPQFVYSYMAALNYPSKETNTLMYNNILLTKGMLLKAHNKIKDTIYKSQNKELINEYEQLLTLNELMSKETTDSELYQSIKVEAQEKEKGIMYELLNIEVDEFNWQHVRSSLKPNEVAIEFVAFPLLDATSDLPIKYVALLTKADSKYPQLIPLCWESQLDSLLSIKERGTEKHIEYLYRAEADSDKENELLQAVWKPLNSYLNGIETIYYSSTGLLNRVSIPAIPINKNTRLIDKYNLQQVSSTAEISKLKDREQIKPATAVIYGGISYDALTDSLLSASKPYTFTKPSTDPLTIETPERKGWNYLEWTGVEADSIEAVFYNKQISSKMFKHHLANEESFKNLNNSPTDIIHIATHGYYFSDAKKMELNKFISQKSTGNSAPKTMLRSGILLAGANRAWMNKNLIPDIEDGVLTSDEIARVNLSGTQLVALSACNTGLGNISIVEGVFGLQRAFKLAGAESVLMTLWSVPDEATSELMINFYKHWLSGMNKRQALTQAQQKLRIKYPNPYYWAGFILLD